MSFELYSLIPGQQVKRDRDLSNVTIQCDPLAVYPNNRTAAGVAAAGNRFKPGEAGKLAVEEEICDLTVNGNLEVKGKLKLNGDIAAEICNIFCPANFNLVAARNIDISTAGDTSILSINTQADVTNAIHLHIPNPGTGAPVSTSLAQINIQNSYNDSAFSVTMRSDLGGVQVLAAEDKRMIPPCRRPITRFSGIS